MRKKANPPKKSEILETVHTSAKGLNNLGLINKRKMKEFDILCLKEIPDDKYNRNLNS